uniref:OTU domain-containing protein n=1 Tax=Panagrolaimus davidi TaxID=227884 RepID=A0A914Q189_9BILA
MIIHDVDRDGNCGYRVLSYLLTGTEDFHWIIRLKVMDHIAKNGDKIRGIWTVSVKLDFQRRYHQIANKTHPQPVNEKHWAGNNDFCGFSSLVNINIFSNIEGTSRWAPHIKDDGYDKEDSALFIVHVNDNHFMAVVGI